MAKAPWKDLLGGKGAGLAEMTNGAFPASWIQRSRPSLPLLLRQQEKAAQELAAQQKIALDKLQKTLKKSFGDKTSLCLSPSARAPSSPCPAMMDTILNLGINDVRRVESLTKLTNNPRFAWMTYRAYRMYGT